MSVNWPTRTVQQLQDEGLMLVEDGNHGEYRPRPDEFSSEGTPFIRASDMDGGRIQFSTASRINNTALSRIRKGIGRPGDILLSHKGTVGKLAMAPPDSEPFVCSPQTTFWRVLNESVIDRRFLYYFMQSFQFQRQIDAIKGETDMADYASLTAQRRFSIPIIGINLQRSIGSALGILDEKIELNRQMNETLEAMSRAVFKDWFIDFGPTRTKMERRSPYLASEIWSLFPDCLDDFGRPEGWICKPLDQLADFLNGLALQKYPAKEGGGITVIKIAQLRSGSVKAADIASVDIPGEYIVDDGDVLFSWSGSLLHRVWTAGRGELNQHLFKVTSKDFPKWIFFYWIDKHMPSFRATAASKATTMGHIQRHHLTQAATIIGTPPVMKAADDWIGPLFNRQIANDLESRTLAAMRDFLLPRLVSGALRVKDAEAIIERTS
jgi:type I restriction enzyme S subunit